MRFYFGLILAAHFVSAICAADAIPLSISQLTQRAELIVRAKVESKSVARDSKGRIFTEVKLAVLEAWKGETQEPTLTVIHSGGILGEKKIVALGQANYELGEELVGFYVFNPEGHATTVAMEQGKLRIDRDTIEQKGERVSLPKFKANVLEAIK